MGQPEFQRVRLYFHCLAQHGESDHACDKHVDEQVAGANLYPGVLDCHHLPSFRKLLFFYQIPRAVCPQRGHRLSFSAKIIYLHLSQNVLSVAFLPNFIYSCLVHVTWFQEKKKTKTKSFHVEILGSQFPAGVYVISAYCSREEEKPVCSLARATSVED